MKKEKKKRIYLKEMKNKNYKINKSNKERKKVKEKIINNK